MARMLLILATVATLGIAADDRIEADPEHAYSAFSPDKHRRFDFWIGQWDVNLRMLDEDGTFHDRVAAQAHIYSILNGKAVLELWDSRPIKGYSLRYYDPGLDRWVLWLNWPGQNRSGLSRLEGQFRHGRGEFVGGYRSPEGEEITFRYAFSDITPFSLRWDDLRSTDGGRTWSENWRMEFTRTALEPDWRLESVAFPTYDQGQRCDSEPFRAYEDLAGHWHGRINGTKASLSSWKILDGCALVVFLDIESRPLRKRFMTLTWDTTESHWEVAYLEDDRDTVLQRFTSDTAWNLTRLEDRRLHWQIDGGALEYALLDERGQGESGRFERQHLEGH